MVKEVMWHGITLHVPLLFVMYCHSLPVPKSAEQCLNLPKRAITDIYTADIYRAFKELYRDDPSNLRFQHGAVDFDQHLDVILIPHSHNDAGWLRTFDEYARDVDHVLDNAVAFMPTHARMKFVETEVAFFERWWRAADERKRSVFKALADNGDVEFLTGGWVQTDEANAHYYSIIMELFEGHEFLKNHLNYTVRSHWAIDPFGHSPVIPQLTAMAGIHQNVIDRTHYLLKREFASRKSFEFMWRPHHAGESNEYDVLTHMTPYHYTVCQQLDYKSGLNGIPTSAQVPMLAEDLVENLRKKAQMMRTNTVFVTVGDDFTYRSWQEWKIRFGTLDDYFKLMKEKLAKNPPEAQLPTVTGDFFTYADAYQNYWSGYFTSRPFVKHLDRSLQQYLRAADLYFSLAHAQSTQRQQLSFDTGVYDELVRARRALALFQHHDGVTGTSRTYVMKDYEDRLEAAIRACQVVIGRSLAFLQSPTYPMDRVIELEEQYLPKQPLVKRVFNESKNIVTVMNSLAQRRQEVVCIRVPHSEFGVEVLNGEKVEQQVHANFERRGDSIVADGYDLCFVADLQPLGYTSFKVFKDSTVKPIQPQRYPFVAIGNDIRLSNGRVGGIAGDGSTYVSAVQDFVYYRTTKSEPSSGAYLFAPNGADAPEPHTGNSFYVIRGPVRQMVLTKGPANAALFVKIIVDKDAKGIRLEDWADISGERDFELGMTITFEETKWTDVDEFYTEDNGFMFEPIQSTRRFRYDHLHIGARFFPMPGAALIQNPDYRFTVFGKQPRGVASLKPGQIQIMLDRRISTAEDWKGMSDPVDDNFRTLSEFVLVLEARKDGTIYDPRAQTVYHSLENSQLSRRLLHQPIVAFQEDIGNAQPKPQAFSLPLPDDVQIVALRSLNQPTNYTVDGSTVGVHTRPKQKAALILHRVAVDCSMPTGLLALSNGRINVNELFAGFRPTAVNRATLTAANIDPETEPLLELKPMELKTAVLSY